MASFPIQFNVDSKLKTALEELNGYLLIASKKGLEPVDKIILVEYVTIKGIIQIHKFLDNNSCSGLREELLKYFNILRDNSEEIKGILEFVRYNEDSSSDSLPPPIRG